MNTVVSSRFGMKSWLRWSDLQISHWLQQILLSPLHPSAIIYQCTMRGWLQNTSSPQVLHQTTCSLSDYKLFFLSGLKVSHRNENKEDWGFFHCSSETCLFLIKVLLDISQDLSFLTSYLGLYWSSVFLHAGDSLMSEEDWDIQIEGHQEDQKHLSGGTRDWRVCSPIKVHDSAQTVESWKMRNTQVIACSDSLQKSRVHLQKIQMLFAVLSKQHQKSPQASNLRITDILLFTCISWCVLQNYLCTENKSFSSPVDFSGNFCKRIKASFWFWHLYRKLGIQAAVTYNIPS